MDECEKKCIQYFLKYLFFITIVNIIKINQLKILLKTIF